MVFDFLAGGKARVGSDGQLRSPHKGRRQKDKNQALGRRFFWALFFGRAKKSATGPGRSAWPGCGGGTPATLNEKIEVKNDSCPFAGLQ